MSYLHDFALGLIGGFAALWARALTLRLIAYRQSQTWTVGSRTQRRFLWWHTRNRL